MAGKGQAGHAFISYAPTDAVAVDRLQRGLEEAGIPVWRDISLLPGDDWKITIRRAISDDALVFIACFSTDSLALKASGQNEEFTLAIEQMRARPPDEPWLIPVRFDDCRIPDWDIGGGRTLGSIRAADLFGERAVTETGRLIVSIQRILGNAVRQSGSADTRVQALDSDHGPRPSEAVGTPPFGYGRSIFRRIMSLDVAVRAALVGGVFVIVAGLIPYFLGAYSGTPSPDASRPGATSPSQTASRGISPKAARTWTETVFSDSDTFADYVSAGNPKGAPLSAGQTVQVSCRLRGFKVRDGDRWWYRLASPPWDGQYYATSDVFYNTASTSGSGVNGVLVDKRVRIC